MKNDDKLVCIEEINDYDFIFGNIYKIFYILNYENETKYSLLDEKNTIVTLNYYEIKKHFKLERIAKLQKKIKI